MTTQPPSAASAAPPILRDPIGWLCVALGLAARAWLYASGRSPLDGDEAILGAMGFHVATFERFPIYFYGQHYMGSLEVPVLAAIQFLGPESWKFSAIPIKLTCAIYFVGLALMHHALCRRLFGVAGGRWALFFLCVGPTFLIDFTFRLRHVVVMCALGELMAWVALDVADAWRNRREDSLRRATLLGFAAGAAFWHYQLVLVFFPCVAALLVALAPGWVAGWFRSADGSRAADGAAAGRAALAWGAVAGLAGLSLGAFAGDRERYIPIVASLLAVFAAGALPGLFAARRELARAAGDPEGRRRALLRAVPFGIAGGFLVGTSPALVYLIGLRETFFLPPNPPQLEGFFSRLGTMFMMEFAAMLEITRPAEPGSNAQVVDFATFANFCACAVAAYATGRAVVRPSGPGDRAGAGFFVLLAVCLVGLNVGAPRAVDWLRPRFLVPAFLTTSVGFGLAARDALAAVAVGGAAARRAGAIAIGIGAFAVWEPIWAAQPAEAMHWPSGHRALAVEIVRELERRGARRATVPRASAHVIFAYELQFVARLEIRLNKGDLGDRMGNVLDESRYGGPLYMIAPASVADRWLGSGFDLDLARRRAEERGGFAAGHFVVFPLADDESPD